MSDEIEFGSEEPRFLPMLEQATAFALSKGDVPSLIRYADEYIRLFSLKGLLKAHLTGVKGHYPLGLLRNPKSDPKPIDSLFSQLVNHFKELGRDSYVSISNAISQASDRFFAISPNDELTWDEWRNRILNWSRNVADDFSTMHLAAKVASPYNSVIRKEKWSDYGHESEVSVYKSDDLRMACYNEIDRLTQASRYLEALAVLDRFEEIFELYGKDHDHFEIRMKRVRMLQKSGNLDEAHLNLKKLFDERNCRYVFAQQIVPVLIALIQLEQKMMNLADADLHTQLAKDIAIAHMNKEEYEGVLRVLR